MQISINIHTYVYIYICIYYTYGAVAVPGAALICKTECSNKQSTKQTNKWIHAYTDIHIYIYIDR